MKTLKFLACAFIGALTLASCGDDHDLVNDDYVNKPNSGGYGAFIINQGNEYGKIDGSLDFYNFLDHNYTTSIFRKANGQSLGMSPQDGVVYGSKLYVVMSGNDLVWVLNPQTHKVLGSVKTASPQGIAAAAGNVFVTNTNGTVTKIDTASLAVVGTAQVGPNPVDMEVRGGKLYVSISDGWNYANNYKNGFRVACLSLATLEKEKDIKVGMNPYKMTQDGNGNIFVVCNGNYGNEPAKVYKIATDDTATYVADASIAAAHGNTLYLIQTTVDPTNFQPKAVYSLRDSRSGKELTYNQTDFVAPLDPIAMSIQPRTGDVYITSHSTLDGKTKYTTAGQVYVYTKDLKHKRTLNAGVEPYGVVFY